MEEKSLTFTKWGPGDPNNRKGVEDWIITYVTGVWIDVSCDSRFLIVCEMTN